MSFLPDHNSHVRLLIVHPDDRVSRRYMSDLIGQKPFLYARFSGSNIDFEQAQDTVFCDFESIGDCDFYPDAFIIDECDRLSPQAFNDLLPYLMQCNPIPIVLFSRNFPSILVENDGLFNQTDIISLEEDVFNKAYERLPVLEVFGFGMGRARVNGHAIDLTHGDLLHQIFFYVLENQIIMRDDLIRQFWSHLDPKAAIVNFHVTRQKLKEIVGAEFLVLRGSHYEINPNIAIYYDAAVFRDAASHELRNSGAHRAERLRQAYRLHHHDFLQGSNADWIVARRHELRDLQCDVCFELAKMAQTNETAIGLYSQAFRYNPYREDIAYAMMSIYINMGLNYDALKVYEALEANLWQRHQLKPNKFLIQLMQQAKVNCRA